MSAGGYNGMRISTWIMAAALLGPGLAAHAQDNPTYKVDFTIRDTGDAGGKTGGSIPSW